ncbi:MAG: hypothetical protein R2727_06705 [Bacteroidales bacterium]
MFSRLRLEKSRETEEQRQVAVEQEQLAEEAEKNAIEASEQRNIALVNADSARNAELANVQRRLALTKCRAYTQEAEARRQEQEAIRNAEIAKENEKQANVTASGHQSAADGHKSTRAGRPVVLLAYQAYLFNLRNGGVPNDADIYMGLYSVAKLFGGANYKSFAGQSGPVCLYRLPSFLYLRIRREINGRSTGTWGRVALRGDEVFGHSVSPDGKYLACGSDNSTIKLIPLLSGEVTTWFWPDTVVR